MAMSGILLDAEALEVYNSFKGSKSSIAFVTYYIKGEKSISTETVVQKDEIAAKLKDLENDGFRKHPNEPEDFAVLRASLLKLPPRYAVIKLNFHQGDTVTEKVAFIAWCSDNAPVKERMLISSSKDNIVKKLEGAVVYKASDESELEYRTVCDQISKGKAKWN